MAAEVITTQNAERKAIDWGVRKASTDSLGVIILLYGQGGAGKTTLAAECYKLGKTMLIDAEGGSDVLGDLAEEENLDIKDVENYAEFGRVVDKLILNPAPYEYVIVDNLSEIDDLCEAHYGIKGDDSHDLQKYNLVKKEIMRRIRQLRNLSRTKRVTVIICCWDADEKDERNVMKKDLALTPKLRQEIPGIITIVGHIRVTRDPNSRVLDLAPGPKTVAKFKRSRNSTAKQVPFEIPYTLDKLPLVDVLNTIRGKGDWPSKEYKAAKSEEE